MKVIIASLFILCGSCLPCAAAELSGTVRSRSGKPLAEVWVYSSDFRRSKTDANGRYELLEGNPSPGDRIVLCFWSEGFRPVIKVVSLSENKVDVTLEELDGSDRVIPTCGKANKSEKRLGTFLQVLVSKETAVKKGRYRHGKFFYIFVGTGKKRPWIYGIGGIYATNGFPRYDWVLTTREYTSRPWRDVSGNQGMDVRGRSEHGTYWRYFGFWGEAVMYSGVTREEAMVLDQIIDSVCFIKLDLKSP